MGHVGDPGVEVVRGALGLCPDMTSAEISSDPARCSLLRLAQVLAAADFIARVRGRFAALVQRSIHFVCMLLKITSIHAEQPPSLVIPIDAQSEQELEMTLATNAAQFYNVNIFEHDYGLHALDPLCCESYTSVGFKRSQNAHASILAVYSTP